MEGNVLLGVVGMLGKIKNCCLELAGKGVSCVGVVGDDELLVGIFFSAAGTAGDCLGET